MKACTFRCSWACSRERKDKRSTDSSDRCTACWLMGLFIIIFGVLPMAETRDQCFGAPLQGKIGEGKKGGCASSLLIIQPLSLLLSPSVSLSQTCCWPRLNWLDKTPLISSVAQTWSLWNANSPALSGSFFLTRGEELLRPRIAKVASIHGGSCWTFIKSGTSASQLYPSLTGRTWCSLLEYIFIMSLINTD